MDIPLTWEDIGYGFGIPALVGCFVLWNLRWMLPANVGRRYPPAMAFCASTLTGFVLLKLGPVQPETHWQWLPHFLIVASLVGMSAASSELNILDRFFLFALASVAASYFMVPTWELTPPRLQYAAGFVGLVVLMSLLYRQLIVQTPGPMLPFILFGTQLTGAVIAMHSGSLLFGQVGLTAAGGLLGMTIASRIDKESRSLDGLAFPAAFFSCGLMMIGHTYSYSSIPIYAYALVPLAPLGLFLTSLGSFSKAKGTKAGIMQLLLPILICGVALGLAFWFEPLTGVEEY